MAVPEGLPMAVLISLAYSVHQMAKDNNTVKNLSACETMSTVSEICTDKTGTLTKNEMEVKFIYLGTGLKKVNECSSFLKNNEKCKEMVKSVCINSDANVEIGKPLNTQKGNPTEKGIIKYADDIGIKYTDYRQKENILNRMPFSSKNKFAAALFRETQTGRVTLHLKGAPELIIEACRFYTDESNKIHQMDKAFTSNLTSSILVELGKEQSRTLGVAVKDMGDNFDCINIDWMKEFKDMKFLGLFGISDPLRADVPVAIKLCHKAGINVRICTGDAKEIAVSIGKECGLIDDDMFDPENDTYTVMLGKDFREACGGPLEEYVDDDDLKNKNDDDENKNEEGEKKNKAKLKRYRVRDMEGFRRVEKHLKILARSQPEDKTL